MLRTGLAVAALVQSFAASRAADPCACKYSSGLPEEFWKGGEYDNLPMISQYGTSCGPWDSVAGTPWFADYCNTSAGKDYCSPADSWCDDSWCYVDQACDTFISTSVFSGVEGLGYSYKKCGSPDCYSNTTAAGCPHDPTGACGDPCECLYAEHGLPEEVWKSGQYENLSMISQYGATCAGWDSVPGTPWYSDYCNASAGKNYCHKDDSWCAAAWCYVSKSCPTWTATTVFKDVDAAPADMGYSYQKCGAPDCYADTNAEGCPYDWDGTCCQCKYKELPEAFWKDGQYENLAMISGYGTACLGWDSVPGTPWFTGYCDTSAGKDYCSSDASWCNDPWCYVDKDTCNSWIGSSVFSDGQVAPDNLGYSYALCGSPNCYGSFGEDCPYDPDGVCDGTEMTCGDVKSKYKDGECCGNPSKKIRI